MSDFRCESARELDGRPCGHKAAWLVQVGHRSSDQQLACSHHLNHACTAMIGAEGRLHAFLTLQRLDAMPPEAVRALASFLAGMTEEN